jgi:hypothetical protein
MILFGAAEMVTGLTHKFLGISTALGAVSALLASGIGTLYTISGLLLLTMRRRAAAVSVACLIVVVVGRIGMVVSGAFPFDSFEQIFAMTVGTGIATFFAAYIVWNWQAFR